LESNRVSIVFCLDPDDWHAHPSERVWGEPVPSEGRHLFRLLNSPFLVRGANFCDVVEANLGPDNDFHFARVVEYSGHSTYMILVPVESKDFTEIWKELEPLGCSYETTKVDTAMGLMTLYSLDVPESTNLPAAYAVLKRAHRQGKLLLQEGFAAVTRNKLRATRD